mgnify:CR=1 FL=1
MSFFKKVNDTDDKPVEEATDSTDKSTSYSDVNTEISDLDSLLDKVLAEKKADRPAPSPDGEIRSVKASDLLMGLSSSEPEEPEETLLNQDEPKPSATVHEESPVEEALDPVDNNSSVSAALSDDSTDEPASDFLGEEKHEPASDFLGEEKHETDSAASILTEETPYGSTADDLLSGSSSDDRFTEPESSHVSETFSPETHHYDKPEPDYSSDDTVTGDSTEDALLVQIDAFRDKAIRLSGLINANQKKVLSLEAEVKKKEGQISDKENQIAALQDELSTKQKEADALVTTVETQVDRMLVSVKKEVSTLNNELSGQITRENHEESARIASIVDKVNSSVLEIKDYLAHAEEDTSLEDMKEELSEKIHSENVKVYRNIQDTMKEMDHSEQLDISIDEKYRSLKHRTAFLLIVLIINLIVSAVILLMNAGIIPNDILSLLGL